MDKAIQAYNDNLPADRKAVCDVLANEICQGLPEAESKVWHGAPVWFLNGNPIVGYSSAKDAVDLLFWSGQSFDESGLAPRGKHKAAGTYITGVDQINRGDVQRWLAKSRHIQWDYKNIVKRQGELVWLEPERQ